ncbi:MAG: MFS transporter [Actinomycetota bacterium]|nr:MFS transporter [Actinomycetota bacterium]
MLFAAEGALYSAIAPLVPHYAHTLHLSRSGAGVLVATYSAGVLVGAVVAGQLIGRIGPRRTIVLGLAVVGASSIAFGVANNVALLDALRTVQGGGAGLLWAAGLAWIISTGDPERRGALLGTAFGAAIFGTLVGPLVGTFAAAVSPSLAFGVVAMASLGLGLLVARIRADEGSTRESGTPLRSALAKTDVLMGLWLVLLPAAAFGIVNTLAPLRMASLGASGIAVGATFVVAAAIATATSPAVGYLTDRVGTGSLARLTLVVTAACLAVLMIPHAGWGVAVLTVVFVGVVGPAWTIPAVTMLTSATDRAGLSQGLAAMLLNIAFALGETVGSPAAANLAQIGGDELPFALLAAVSLVTAVIGPDRVGRGQVSARAG